MEEKFYERIEGYHSINSVSSSLISKVYVWMTLALAITGITAYGVATTPTLFMTMGKMMWGLIIAELVLVFTLSAAINRLSLSVATLMFIVYSVLNGCMLSSIFYVYSPMIITKVFFITAGTFGITAAYGYATKRDLSSFGRIFYMALLGLFIATVVNFFMKSATLDYLLSYAGVIIFTGLTAWDSQKIRKLLQMQYEVDEKSQKLALLGALTLYLDFINLFLYLLKIFGNKK
ncbi:Bax inhibitor-1/YccA family protein [Segatella copri]|uniref:BAX inhibitor (BI)-1/YccA family protein n=1 Tax=Segatella copri TaxID=165179 RepID=A0AA92WHA5_9BACT|nr:Bax inhibitor-1/YccA family protein [Segatella copri]RHA83114.1 BAX inhibitor (BI)-1/YccA family protein [Segatella copri]